MELSGEDRTHLELLWTSPSKLAREESSPKDEVPQADGGYLVKTQVRRAKSFLRLITCLTCPTVANTSSGSWSEEQMGKESMETAPALAQEEVCPCTVWLGWKMWSLSLVASMLHATSLIQAPCPS